MKTKPITQDELCGIWAALPVPWRKDGELDAQMYARDIVRCCRAGVQGIYSGGTTGEFYVQDFDRFCRINRVLTETAHAHRTPVQAGCTALCTEEACKRVRYAGRIGADIVQVALPFWLELDDEEVLEFFKAIAQAAGRTPIVHYDTGRSKRRISPQLYRRLRQRVPTLWGTKFGGADVYAVKQITLANPGLKVFVGEHVLASATPMGATGAYSSVVLVNPSWMLEYYEACRDRRWERAFQIQDEVGLFFSVLDTLPTPHLQDTAIDRILGQSVGFLECSIESQPPYRHGTSRDLQQVRNWLKQHLPHVFHRAGWKSARQSP